MNYELKVKYAAHLYS